jgi:hypothetical protein
MPLKRILALNFIFIVLFDRLISGKTFLHCWTTYTTWVYSICFLVQWPRSFVNLSTDGNIIDILHWFLFCSSANYLQPKPSSQNKITHK